MSNTINQSSIHATNDHEAIAMWLNEFVTSPNTFTSYEQCTTRFMLWCKQEGLSLANIKREDILGYQNFLANPTPVHVWCGPAKARNHPQWRPFVKGLSPNSIKLNLQILTALYAYLVEGAYLRSNPFSMVRRKSASLVNNKSIDRFLTTKEWNYILDFIQHSAKIAASTAHTKCAYHRIRWIFNLLYLTGCRRHEIISARMSDFVRINGNWWLKVIGKGNKYGEVPVTNSLLEELIVYRKSIGLSDFPQATETHIPLVCELPRRNVQYKPLSDSMLYKLIKNTCQQVADSIKSYDAAASFVIERVSTHWLRHTSATHQVNAGIDIRVVKDNLRHSMLETTMKYQHTEADARHQETNSRFGIKKT